MKKVAWVKTAAVASVYKENEWAAPHLLSLAHILTHKNMSNHSQSMHSSFIHNQRDFWLEQTTFKSCGPILGVGSLVINLFTFFYDSFLRLSLVIPTADPTNSWGLKSFFPTSFDATRIFAHPIFTHSWRAIQ
jgi:hypothetical protein